MSELATFSDEVLLGQLSDPERAAHAFDELYNRHWSRLYLIAYNRLRSRGNLRGNRSGFFHQPMDEKI